MRYCNGHAIALCHFCRTMLRDNEDTIGEYVRLLIQSLHSHVVSNEPHQVQDLGNQIFDALDVNEDGSLTKACACGGGKAYV